MQSYKFPKIKNFGSPVKNAYWKEFLIDESANEIVGDSFVKPESNVLDLRNKGICPECQVKVLKALFGEGAEWKNYDEN